MYMYKNYNFYRICRNTLTFCILPLENYFFYGICYFPLKNNFFIGKYLNCQVRHTKIFNTKVGIFSPDFDFYEL